MTISNSKLDADEIVEKLKKRSEKANKDFAPSDRNLVYEIDEEFLEEIADECLGGFRTDLLSRAEWEKMRAGWIDMYFQRDIAANPPWEGSSEECIPMLAEAVNQFAARTSKLFLSAGSDAIAARPTGEVKAGDEERAKRVATHMGWQLFVQNRTYRRDKDRLMMTLGLQGNGVTKTYYDPVKRMNKVENVRIVDFVVNYGVGPRDIEDIPRKTEICYLPVNKTRELTASGFFCQPAEQCRKPTPNSAIDEAIDAAVGVERIVDEHDDTAVVLEQHCFIDLDGDGIGEPYIVWLDYQSEKILRLAVRYEVDDEGLPIADKAPIEHYNHYVLLENPDGFYGLGFGHLIGLANRAVNKLLRQTVDSATLANTMNQSGFYRQTTGIAGGEVEVELGKYVPYDSMSDDIRRDFITLQHPGPNSALIQMMQFLAERGDRLAMVTDLVTGKPDKVYQPTTTMALLDQANIPLTAIAQRIKDAWSAELRKLYRLNSLYLDEQEYFAVMDASGLKQQVVGRVDYAEDLQIVPSVDPDAFTMQQRVARAEAEWQFIMQLPFIQTGQFMTYIYNAARRYLEAIGTHNIDEILPNIPELMREQAKVSADGQVANEVMGELQGYAMGGGQADGAIPPDEVAAGGGGRDDGGPTQGPNGSAQSSAQSGPIG